MTIPRTDRASIHLGWPTLAAILWLGLQTAIAWASATAGGVEAYRYREITGESVKTVDWRLTKGDTFVLTTATARERNVTVAGPGYDTIEWRTVNAQEQTHLTARRHGDAIALSGRFKGEPIDRTLAIDDRPWYQATSLSLRDFIASADTERAFWTIRTDTLTVHRVKAIKKGIQRVEAGNRPKALLHIRLTLPGWRGPFWKSDYWFGLPDGVFYRFEGPSGPPGAPMTTVIRTAG